MDHCKLKHALTFATAVLLSTSLDLNAQDIDLESETPEITQFAYSSDEGELVTIKVNGEYTIDVLDIDGLAYIGDMILGHTDELKLVGLNIAEHNHKHENDFGGIAPRSVIRFPNSGYIWPNGVVPYQISRNLSNRARRDFQYAVNHWNSQTNIKLVQRTNQRDYISVEDGNGCSSWIGRSGGRQKLTLASNCGQGAAVHEIGHAVGLFHEQSRTDRDDYVTILWQNISRNMQYNFQKVNRNQGMDYGTYDYYSIMHYRTNAFGSGKQTIRVRNRNINQRLIGNGNQLSTKDKAAIAYMYGGQTPDPIIDPTPKRCDAQSIETGRSYVLNGEDDSQQCFSFLLPNNVDRYTVTIAGDNGDVDLYVKQGQPATKDNYDCSSKSENSYERCSAQASSGRYYVYVHGYYKFTDAVLTADYTLKDNDPIDPPITPACKPWELTKGVEVSLNLREDSDMCFTFNSTGEQARFNTFGGSGDLDLFVKKGAPAATSNFDCKSDEPTNQEACTFNSNGLFYVYVKAISDVENAVLVAK